MATIHAQDYQKTQQPESILKQRAMLYIINREHAYRTRKKRALNRALRTTSASESSSLINPMHCGKLSLA